MPAGTQSTFASIDHPTSLAFDRSGNLYVGTALNIIFKFTPTGTKNNFATVNTDVKDLAFEPPTGILANISTRADVKTGAQVLIAGFVVTGYVNTGRAPFLSGLPEPLRRIARRSSCGRRLSLRTRPMETTVTFFRSHIRMTAITRLGTKIQMPRWIVFRRSSPSMSSQSLLIQLTLRPGMTWRTRARESGTC